MRVRDLDPEHIDTLVQIKGMVIRVAHISPEMKQAFFECCSCKFSEMVAIDDGQIQEPVKCNNCGESYTMQMIHNRCLFEDMQLVKLQETPGESKDGETPHSVTLHVWNDLVDVAKPGDRVFITGVYRAESRKVNPRMRTLRTIYKTFIDVLHIRKTDKRQIAVEDAGAEPNTEAFTKFDETDTTHDVRQAREEELKKLATDPNIYERLCRSLAPNIWEMNDVKKGILCQLFGGANVDMGAGHGKFRGELNVLLCGDPGTSKSQLLQWVHKLSPRGVYTSGKGSSAVGLTASIKKDPETNEVVLESGALVLSDRGICCIDEFDKMSDATRSILHEVMEQQTVSIAKAGIVTTLNARTSILASANPKESRYNPELSVVQNIQLMPTLLSRFDLIYLVLDQPNELRDRKLAKHIVSLYQAKPEGRKGRTSEELIPMETLTEYISLARRSVQPELSEQAREDLINGYVELRRMGSVGQRKVITATPRQLESLIRLSEALARMRFSSSVDKEDVQEARRLMSVATQTAATDPKTGKIDMDLLQIGTSSSDRKKLEQQASAVKDLLKSYQKSKTALVMQVYKRFNDTLDESLKVTQTEFRKILDVLQDEGVLTIQKAGKAEAIKLVDA